MKRFWAMCILTPAEQRLVIFAVIVLCLGSWSKHRREARLDEAPLSTVSPTPAPASPNDL